jgi:hypothetical protein
MKCKRGNLYKEELHNTAEQQKKCKTHKANKELGGGGGDTN